MAREQEGLRERKKRATRDAIAATARRLFAQRGFDRVTVAEIAVAADVSEKTVFNHFATKEDLAFAGGEARLTQVLTDLAQRPAGTSVLDVFRAATDAMAAGLARAGEDDERLVAARIIRDSRVLAERLATGWEDEAAALAAAVARAAGAPEDDVVAAVVARTLALTHRSIYRAGLAGLLAGEDPRKLAKRLRADAARAYDQLGVGLDAYGRMAPVPQ